MAAEGNTNGNSLTAEIAKNGQTQKRAEEPRMLAGNRRGNTNSG